MSREERELKRDSKEAAQALEFGLSRIQQLPNEDASVVLGIAEQWIAYSKAEVKSGGTSPAELLEAAKRNAQAAPKGSLEALGHQTSWAWLRAARAQGFEWAQRQRDSCAMLEVAILDHDVSNTAPSRGEEVRTPPERDVLVEMMERQVKDADRRYGIPREQDASFGLGVAGVPGASLFWSRALKVVQDGLEEPPANVWNDLHDSYFSALVGQYEDSGMDSNEANDALVRDLRFLLGHLQQMEKTYGVAAIRLTGQGIYHFPAEVLERVRDFFVNSLGVEREDLIPKADGSDSERFRSRSQGFADMLGQEAAVAEEEEPESGQVEPSVPAPDVVIAADSESVEVTDRVGKKEHGLSCGACGERLPKRAKYCPDCGKRQGLLEDLSPRDERAALKERALEMAEEFHKRGYFRGLEFCHFCTQLLADCHIRICTFCEENTQEAISVDWGDDFEPRRIAGGCEICEVNSPDGHVGICSGCHIDAMRTIPDES